jgi:type IV pilus assembly protein PilW
VFQGTVVPPTLDAFAPRAIFAILEYAYYIGSDDSDVTIPALRRVALQSDGSMMDEMVVSGIENLQVRYGLAKTNINSRYYDAGSVTGSSLAPPTTDWNNVNSVRIWLLARNKKAEAGYININSYVMGDKTYGPLNDGFRRQVYTSVVQLRN